jgi:hypothetical protein
MLADVSEPSDRLEPYQELPGDILFEAVSALQAWAKRQPRPWRPFAEMIDGATIRPLDLLVQRPPASLNEFDVSLPESEVSAVLAARPPRRLGRLVLRLSPPNPRAWPHVLNLVAVSARYEDVHVLLEELRTGELHEEGPSPGLTAS